MGRLKTTLVQLPLTTLGQETRWAYSTTPPSSHGEGGSARSRGQSPWSADQGRTFGLWRADTTLTVG